MRASSSDRGVVCPASLFTIVPERPRSESSQKAIDWGTLCHFWKETGDVHMPGASPSDVRCLEKKLLMSGVEREDWWIPGPGQHEVTFALHLKSAADGDPTSLHLFPGDNPSGDGWVDRDTWKTKWDPKEYLTGTIDWLENDWVDDLKTGHWKVDETTSKQLLSYALVPWALSDFVAQWKGTVSITQWERYPLHGQPERREHLIGAPDLHEHLQDLIYAADHPDAFNASDEGCRFCDVRPTGLCAEWPLLAAA